MIPGDIPDNSPRILELILGSPTSISEKNGYELWVYESNELNGSLKSISNYFFRNSLLIELDHY